MSNMPGRANPVRMPGVLFTLLALQTLTHASSLACNFQKELVGSIATPASDT